MNSLVFLLRSFCRQNHSKPSWDGQLQSARTRPLRNRTENSFLVREPSRIRSVSTLAFSFCFDFAKFLLVGFDGGVIQNRR